MEASVNSAIEFIRYLVRSRRTHGYLVVGFNDWESFFAKVAPAFHFGQPAFLMEMMDLEELGKFEDLAHRVHDKILSHTLEHVNQGDN